MRTAYLDSGDGEPVVALHGIPTSSALFDPLVPLLPGYRLIAPDLLGQGDTEEPREGSLGYKAYRDHLQAFLEAVPPASFNLIVHDFGGVLGMQWAVDHIERVKKLVILSTTISWSFRVGFLLYAGSFMLGRTLLRRGMTLTVKRKKQLAQPLLDQWARPWTRRRILRGADHFSASHLGRLRSRLARIDVPALIVWGEQDDIFPLSHARAIADELPQATLVTIPSCGHWSTIDAPEEVSAHIKAFLDNAGLKSDGAVS